MKLGILLVLYGTYTLVEYVLLALLVPRTHFWDWVDLLWALSGLVCLYFGVRRLSRVRKLDAKR